MSPGLQQHVRRVRGRWYQRGMSFEPESGAYIDDEGLQESVIGDAAGVVGAFAGLGAFGYARAHYRASRDDTHRHSATLADDANPTAGDADDFPSFAVDDEPFDGFGVEED